MTPSSTRSVAAQEAALERIAVLCRTLAADMPISALLLVDRDLRLKLAAGSSWARGGFDPSAIVGLHVREVVPVELHEEVFLHYAAVLQGETRRFVVSHHRPSAPPSCPCTGTTARSRAA